MTSWILPQPGADGRVGMDRRVFYVWRMFPLTVGIAKLNRGLGATRTSSNALDLTLRDASTWCFMRHYINLLRRPEGCDPPEKGACGHSRDDKPRNPRARKRRHSKLRFRKLPQTSPACGSSSIPKNARLLNVPNARRSRKPSAATRIMSLHAVALIDLLTVEVERVLRRQREIGAHD